MKSIQVANDIVPVGQFKADLAKYLREVQEKRNSLIITQNGKAAGVLLSPKEFDELRGTKLFIDSVSRGLVESEEGNIVSTEELKSTLNQNRAARS